MADIDDTEEAFEKIKSLADNTAGLFEYLQSEAVNVRVEIAKITCTPVASSSLGEELPDALCEAVAATIEGDFTRLIGRVALSANAAAIASLEAKIKAESFIENNVPIGEASE